MKIICVGRNYMDHIREMKNTVPEEPTLFMKCETSILKNTALFIIPEFSKNIHYEAEIVIKMSRKISNISESEAAGTYNTFTVGLDMTARDIQKKHIEKGLPWEISKAFDNSAILGDFLPVNNKDALKNLSFTLKKNGKTVQSGNTSDMVFSIEKIIAYTSRYFTLEPGDLIFTGTPAGVGQVEGGDILSAYIKDKQVLEILVQ
jgi:2-keto-4-pentenoate hydratase/2-oxohepta-3-ene-1,7-dioic acid hydratase in catechol pathway